MTCKTSCDQGEKIILVFIHFLQYGFYDQDVLFRFDAVHPGHDVHAGNKGNVERDIHMGHGVHAQARQW